MKDACDFIAWLGGTCPVAAGTRVQIVHRDGSRNEQVIEYPTRWDHLGTPCDIVYYKIISQRSAAHAPAHHPV